MLGSAREVIDIGSDVLKLSEGRPVVITADAGRETTAAGSCLCPVTSC